MLNAQETRERVRAMKNTSKQYSSNKPGTQSKSTSLGPDLAATSGSDLPDVALETPQTELSSLPWVGMSEIEVPVLWVDGDGQSLHIPGKVDAWVSLDLKPARGIHMSRLYLSVQKILGHQALSVSSLRDLTGEFLSSHQDLSGKARVAVEITLPVRRKALVSENMGWRNYPILLVAEETAVLPGTLSGGPNAGSFRLFLEIKITYSSTCPASAALSRQITAAEFLKTFPEAASPARVAEWLGTTQGMPATPHAQRSEARILVDLSHEFLGKNHSSDLPSGLPIVKLIDLIEAALQTPVQAAVKREDEQEFARLNSQNLMFCEDAARRVRECLDKSSFVLDYFGKFQHFESLHPHNAVSFIQKHKAGLSSFLLSNAF